MIHLLSPLAYHVITWKNGGGTTIEIATDPEGAGWDEINWRVSIADIRTSGPFSQFPGIDRSILLLDCPRGTEMHLTIDGKKGLMKPHEFIDFPGEAPAHGDLFGEAVRDFNVMSRRGVIRHRRGFHSVSPNEVFRMGGTDTRVIHVASGTAEMAYAATARTLVAGESIVAAGDEMVELRGGPDGARLVWAVFSSVAAA